MMSAQTAKQKMNSIIDQQLYLLWEQITEAADEGLDTIEYKGELSEVQVNYLRDAGYSIHYNNYIKIYVIDWSEA